ncbi:hypothetical protein PTTG_04238 [Puccinia triticina 1-1 BBBD Race 1]|uniref:PKS_ER domain-containing protein n=2 Tax=Puccinia triticina TaxID=208348 RepID=A0A180GI28_PUCT1|nr:uncharacterized protein PtA15_1A233 [Puccinia triticina]OAV91613.1 hypothetical protein PTTG_04238 [Puccinia triticina 1-1 BBBD Race 1]WAQ80895.1 hypothetical protein PtA15_1A233 [Puccinia triticina]WAR51792.1 hypothetical protein PtB15_1B228 [Puccinia triticina]
MIQLPKTQKSVQIIQQSSVAESTAGKGSAVWHEIQIKESPFEIPERNIENEKNQQSDDPILTIKIKSFAFNHRDVWIRKGLYRKIKFGSTLGSDCFGTVISPSDHHLSGKDVLVYPAVNWLNDPRGGPDVPGKEFGILGGTHETDGLGTFTDHINIPASHCVTAPSHLDLMSASAVPLAGLTAFRAVFNKGQVKPSSNILITGIGGGVAIWALQFCVAIGANVWVTSSSEQKIEQACRLGAKAGVNYTEDSWPQRLASLLPSETQYLDVVIDSGGGDIAQKCSKILRPGGIIVNFGCTSGRPLSFTMAEVLKNLELRGCTMGSLKEFKEMVAFVDKHTIQPVVYKTLRGFEQVEDGFQIVKAGQQFGKVVVVIDPENYHKL